jgi:hypothetical protein
VWVTGKISPNSSDLDATNLYAPTQAKTGLEWATLPL